MRIFVPPPEINSTNGFTTETDLFGRSEQASGLTNLLKIVKDPVVLAVDGKWGSGKTIFLKMWEGDLKKGGFPVIYYDAFKNDYTRDAFSSIASSIYSLIEEKKEQNSTKGQNFLKSSKKISKILLRSALKIGTKAATLNALDLGDIEKDISAETSNLVDKYIGENITKQKEEERNFEFFRTSLSEISSLFCEEDNKENSELKPLIFIIDELDRCRPDFSLEILEKIKHFFSVPNVHFILGVNLEQLQNSISAVYGASIDSYGYLHKFIHFIHKISKNDKSIENSDVDKFVEYISEAHNFPREQTDFVNACKRIIVRIAHHREMSFREIERVFSVLALVVASTGMRSFRPAAVVAPLCVAKILDPQIFQKAKKGTLGSKEMLNWMGISEEYPENRDRLDNHLVENWIYFIDEDPPADVKRSLDGYASQYFIERTASVPYIANSVVNKLLSMPDIG